MFVRQSTVCLWLCAVSSLHAVKRSLIDRSNHLENWNKEDPCAAKWTGVLCFDGIMNDGYLHVRELYGLILGLPCCFYIVSYYFHYHEHERLVLPLSIQLSDEYESLWEFSA